MARGGTGCVPWSQSTRGERECRQFETNAGVADSLCVKLDRGQIGAYVNELDAQAGKSPTVEQADLLAGFAQMLS